MSSIQEEIASYINNVLSTAFKTVRIRFRRGTTTQWEASNPVLDGGEPGYDETTKVFKIGDGVSNWTSLPSVIGESGSSVDLTEIENRITALEEADPPQVDLSSIEGRLSALESAEPVDLTEVNNQIDSIFSTLASKVSTVVVSTGAETRPDSSVVFWVGGSLKPMNMGENDLWFSEQMSAPVDTTPPSIPEGLTSSDINSSSFKASWSASTDAGSSVTYEIQLDGVAVDTTQDTSYIFSDLTPETEYNVRVRAKDGSDNWSELSTTLVVTTLEASGTEKYLSVFGSSQPFSSAVVSAFDDGGGSLKVASKFYATREMVVVGARLWNPPTATSTFLNEDFTFYVWLGQWASTSGSPAEIEAFGEPLQTKIHSATRVAGEWTDVLFDSPITVPAVSGAEDGNDHIVIGYESASGNYYVALVDPGNNMDSQPSTVDPTVHLAESPFVRSAGSLPDLGGGYYGVDILFEEA